MLRLSLRRFFYGNSTLGQLEFIDRAGKPFWTIERADLGNEPFVSCIPEGYFQMRRYDSPKFGKGTWEIVVPDRTFILFHVANYAYEVQGCIGLGESLMANMGGVGSSQKAVKRFMESTKGEQEARIRITSGPLYG